MSYISRPLIKLSGNISSTLENRYTNYCRGLLKSDSGGTGGLRNVSYIQI